MADNDLAMGRIIEGLSRSRFWSDMAVFVNEDDPQTGTDHVDGHTLDFASWQGPYVTSCGGCDVISRFYNQCSVLHTICRIFGAPAMNQVVAMAPLMDECFQDVPNVSRYACLPEKVPLNEMNPGSAKVAGTLRACRPPRSGLEKPESSLAPLIADIDYSKPDLLGAKTELFSRYVWSTVHGDEPFPIEYAGNHGKGLKPLGLAFLRRKMMMTTIRTYAAFLSKLKSPCRGIGCFSLLSKLGQSRAATCWVVECAAAETCRLRERRSTDVG